MQYLDFTCPQPADNLLCDDALLTLRERGEVDDVLRVWAPSRLAVVVGRSNPEFVEVRLGECRSRGIPLLRRPSGGGTVLIGPGCLNYSVVLRTDTNPSVSTIGKTNRFAMERNRGMLERATGQPVAVEGFTDLTIDNRKVSGNAQYRRRNVVLFHGTFLIGLDLALVEELMDLPSVAPDYRHRRSHTEFLMNLDVPGTSLKDGLRAAWSQYDTETLEVEIVGARTL